MSPRSFIIVGMAMELCYLSFYLVAEGPGEVLLFIGVNVATYLLLSVVALRMRQALPAREGENRMVVIVLGLGLLFRLTLVPHGVVGSDDIYRYLWDGKVAASRINPFQYSPTDPRLSHLVSADLPSKVNHPEMRSVYPAAAQALFFVSHEVFGESMAGFKLLIVIIDSLTMLFLWMLLRERGGSILPVVFYAWSPLPVLYFGMDGHIDALGIMFLIVSLMFFLQRRPVRGAVALGLSALAKLVPLVIVPFTLNPEKGIRRPLIPIVSALVVAIGYLLYYEPTWGVFESLRTFSERWEFNGGIFSVVYFLTGSNETAHLVSAVMIVLYIALLAVLDRPLMEKVFWGLVGFVLLSPVVHPWYLTWLASLLVLRWSTSVFVLLGLSCIANLVVYQYRAFGQWNDQPLLLLIEYVPVFVLLGLEVARKEVLSVGEGKQRPVVSVTE